VFTFQEGIFKSIYTKKEFSSSIILYPVILTASCLGPWYQEVASSSRQSRQNWKLVLPTCGTQWGINWHNDLSCERSNIIYFFSSVLWCSTHDNFISYLNILQEKIFDVHWMVMYLLMSYQLHTLYYMNWSRVLEKREYVKKRHCVIARHNPPRSEWRNIRKTWDLISRNDIQIMLTKAFGSEPSPETFYRILTSCLGSLIIRNFPIVQY